MATGTTIGGSQNPGNIAVDNSGDNAVGDKSHRGEIATGGTLGAVPVAHVAPTPTEVQETQPMCGQEIPQTIDVREPSHIEDEIIWEGSDNEGNRGEQAERSTAPRYGISGANPRGHNNRSTRSVVTDFAVGGENPGGDDPGSSL